MYGCGFDLIVDVPVGAPAVSLCPGPGASVVLAAEEVLHARAHRVGAVLVAPLRRVGRARALGR